MAGDQMINLSENPSEQIHGIVLAWSFYNRSTATAESYNWRYTFVPRSHAPGCGVGDSWFNEGKLVTKYVYVNDGNIVGNASNIASDTYAGLARDSRLSALRYVIGV